MRMIWLTAGAAALALAATAAGAQTWYGDSGRDWGPPTPGEQHDMHTGSASTNGSSSVAYDRDGAHADGFPKIRLADNGAPGPGYRRHRHHHRHWRDEDRD